MEIDSFNQLFAEAKRAGVKLFSFHQLDNGDFVARWRREHDEVFERCATSARSTPP